jgi:hypothetical protein
VGGRSIAFPFTSATPITLASPLLQRILPSRALVQVNEVQFVGITFPKWLDGACPVAVTINPLSALQTSTAVPNPVATLSTPFQYSLASTPTVTSLTPDVGSSLGGTQLTLTGAGFGTSLAGVQVVVNGIPCAVSAVSDSSVSCTTGQRPPPPITATESLEVTVSGRGAAVLPVSNPVWFQYLDR